MNKFEKTALWILGLTIIVAHLLYIIYILKAFRFTDNHLGAIASVVGGMITWLGVRATIKNQNDIQKRDRLPEQIKNTWNLVSLFGALEGALDRLKTDKNDIKNYQTLLAAFYDEHEESATELAMTTDGVIYSAVNSLFTHIDDFHAFAVRNELDRWLSKFYALSERILNRVEYLEYELKRLAR